MGAKSNAIVLAMVCGLTAPCAERTVASYMGPECHGKVTASGKVYDMGEFTCAHRYYRLGTKLKISSLDNSVSVVCTVTDRGPYVAGRGLDLSHAAAEILGITEEGVAHVWVEEVKG